MSVTGIPLIQTRSILLYKKPGVSKMAETNYRMLAKQQATNRPMRVGKLHPESVEKFYSENTFNVYTAEGIPSTLKKELVPGQSLSKEQADLVAAAVSKWAISKGVSHFSHWFQPLTGSTAEKHDALLDFKNNLPIQRLTGKMLMQGEPDASSFPHGGSRSTFEARGYTSWDVTSPIFIMEGGNGKTMCIPTAFVSYTGDALDIKTPLLRSITRLSDAATKFMHLTGNTDVEFVQTNCGPEQEYFLVDKAFYYQRPDLIMTGRTLFGSLTARNQQLDDHYFGTIPSRVENFMQELEIELYRVGIPAKTRHNEVAPGQFELAPIFEDANIAADHNQLTMALIKKVAEKHDFVALLHEKPFAGINGSGKHLNWSMSDNLGRNLLEPGPKPHQNNRFLAVTAMVCEAVHRHADVIRGSVASHGNDHRLGANEAPPSIISVFLGETIERIFDAVREGASFDSKGEKFLDMGAEQLGRLTKDNTDRNRTSPFAFTGNRFEFRAVGSSATIGFPLTIVNAAVTELLVESNILIEADLKAGKSIDEALENLTRKWVKSSEKVIFSGDGYSDEWVKEAAKRGLPNLRTSADAFAVFDDVSKTKFLTETGVFTESEIQTRYNVAIERYNQLREIEFQTQIRMIEQHVIPHVVKYKSELVSVINGQKSAGVEGHVEKELLKRINFSAESLYSVTGELRGKLEETFAKEDKACSFSCATELLPLSQKAADLCNEIEEITPDKVWQLPTYLDMLFVR